MKILISILFITLSTLSFSDEYLIEEMENLKAELSADDPDRSELSLRLADVYFDESIQEGSKQSAQKLIEYRQKALNLYLGVLEGRDGLLAPKLEKQVVIKYQIARVLGKLSRVSEAKTYYQDVFNSELASKKIKRESAFSLAEFYEEDVNFSKADHFYVEAINLCESIESCNYAHYKRAWLYYKELKLEVAISELKNALWDRNSQVREKIINDLFLFYSARVTDGSEELAFVKDLAIKSGKTQLVRKLVESFYGAGNRVAGGHVLEEWNKQNPSMFYETRLLEENYGFRDWDKVRHYLTAIEKRNQKDIPKDQEESKELNAMLKRVIVQIDSEAEEDEQYSNDLIRIIDIYLSLYPNDDMRKKLQQGWLKVVKNADQKIERLGLWIKEDLSFKTDWKIIKELRVARLSLAQKENISKIVQEESLALSSYGDEGERRKYEYIWAHEHYKNKDYKKALQTFNKLANVNSESEIDEYAIKSQNLSMDIYNIQKNYKALNTQALAWTNKFGSTEDKKLKAELGIMSKLALDSKFETIVALGKSQAALAGFYDFCFQKVYEKKSCENAKILAVELKDQEKIIALLERENDEKALMVEYEIMGDFLKAAELNEKLTLNSKSEIQTYLKVAVLYELAADMKDRDRILSKLIKKLNSDKKIDPKWVNPLYSTFREAGMLDGRMLTLAWPLEKKIQIAEMLDQNGGNKKAQKLILSQSRQTGPMWSKYILSEVQDLYTKQEKIGFYGRYSESRFKKRNKAIDSLALKAKSYLEGAGSQTRIYLLEILKRAYANLAQEIVSTPLPEDLTPEILAQVQQNIQAMAEPYLATSQDYARLQKEQFLQLDKASHGNVLADLSNDSVNFSENIMFETQDIFTTDQIALGDREILLSKLATNPLDIKSLRGLENFYKSNESLRLASYFTGRINSLKEEHE